MPKKKTAKKPVSLKGMFPVIGEFVVQYAIVQGTLRTVLLRLLGITGNSGAILVHGMGDSTVVKKLKLGLDKHGMGFIKFTPALTSLHDVTGFRNQLIHWMPITDGKRTTLEGIADMLKNFRDPNLQPALNFAPRQMRAIIVWLKSFELDLLTLMLAIDNGEGFDADNYQTLDGTIFPPIPKAQYEALTPMPL